MACCLGFSQSPRTRTIPTWRSVGSSTTQQDHGGSHFLLWQTAHCFVSDSWRLAASVTAGGADASCSCTCGAMRDHGQCAGGRRLQSLKNRCLVLVLLARSVSRSIRVAFDLLD